MAHCNSSREGIVDKDRMCLHGGSYGGYASLQGLVREPDLFKCAHLRRRHRPGSDAERGVVGHRENVKGYDWLDNEFKILVGDSKDDAEMFQRVSPARNADKIKGPR